MPTDHQTLELHSHIFVVVAWLFAFFLLVERARLAPRVLAGLGMLFCPSQFVGITLPVFAGFRMPFSMAFGLPLAFGILALAGWSLVYGFRSASTAPAPSGAHP